MLRKGIGKEKGMSAARAGKGIGKSNNPTLKMFYATGYSSWKGNRERNGNTAARASGAAAAAARPDLLIVRRRRRECLRACWKLYRLV